MVGAGFAGMYAVYHLRSLGFSTQGIERGSGVGGTWYWNRYPGARCDIPSLEYSYSFSPELQQEWDWTRRYPSQPEMLAYANHAADRFDLRRHFLFDTTVTAAHFDEQRCRWVVHTSAGGRIDCGYLVMATGCLSVPRIPVLPGLDDFGGQVVHTATWPEEGLDVRGRRVGVIGTGASGIQVIPVLAEQAEHLTVFQRTASFSVSGANTALRAEEILDVKEHYAQYRERSRRSFGGTMLRANPKSALEVDDAEREAAFERAWADGGFAFLASFRDITTDLEANRLAAEFVRAKIRAMVDDPVTADLLTPTDHPIGTKRICIDSGYYTTFNRPNVRLIDVRRSPIQRVETAGIVTTDGSHPLDVLVLATGFDAMTGALLHVDIRGRRGLRLGDHWEDGPRAYLGIAISGFPNLFTVTGPGSPSVLSNMIAAGEQHVEWIGRCLVHMRDSGHRVIEAEPAAEADWVDHVNDVASATLYPLADSWYVGANVPGKPRVFMPYVGGVGAYRRRCDEVAESGYRGFSFDSTGVAVGPSRSLRLAKPTTGAK